jgi:hypothetical protein
MARVTLNDVYKEKLANIEKEISPSEMGVSCRSINGGYVTGVFRKIESFDDIEKRRRRVDERLKKYEN